MQRRTYVLLSLVGAAVMGILAAIMLDHIDGRIRPSSGFHAVPGRSHTALRFDWSDDARQSYRVALHSTVRLDPAGSGMSEALTQDITGALHLRVFEQTEDRVRLGLQLESLRYHVNDERDRAMEGALAAPFVALLTRQGEPLEFEFPESLSAAERNVLQEILRSFQIVLPKEARRAWTVAEDHVTGRYLADYRVEPGGRVLKQKTLYTDVALPLVGVELRGSQRIELRRSAQLARVNERGIWLRDASVEEDLSVIAGEARIVEFSTRATLEPSDAGSERSVALFRASPGAAALRAMLDDFERPDVALAGAPLAGGAIGSPESRASELVEALNQSGDRPFSVVRSIANAMRKDPRLIPELLRQIEQPSTREASKAWLIHALELAGTPETQNALVQMMNDTRFAPRNRLRAVVALGGVREPTDATLGALIDASTGGDDVQRSESALLALGRIGKQVKYRFPEQSARIRAELHARIGAAHSRRDLEVALEAASNAGDPALAERVAPHLDAPSAFVRAASAKALGRSGAQASQQLLLQRLDRESDARARTAIVAGLEALGQAQAAPLARVHQMLASEPDATTRIEMVRYLASNREKLPEASDTLARLARLDPSERVRRQAARAVAAARGDGS